MGRGGGGGGWGGGFSFPIGSSFSTLLSVWLFGALRDWDERVFVGRWTPLIPLRSSFDFRAGGLNNAGHYGRVLLGIFTRTRSLVNGRLPLAVSLSFHLHSTTSSVSACSIFYPSFDSLGKLHNYTHTHTHTHTAARAADSSIMDNNWSIRDCARCVFNETATLPPSRRLPFSAFHFHKTRFSWLVVVVVVVIVVVVGNGQVFSWRIIRSACYGRRNEAARLLGLHRRVPLPFRSSFVFAPARRWNRSKRLGLIKGASRRRRRRRRRRLLPHETAPRAMAWSRARIKGDDSYGPQKKNKQKGTFQTVLGHRKPSFP